MFQSVSYSMTVDAALEMWSSPKSSILSASAWYIVPGGLNIFAFPVTRRKSDCGGSRRLAGVAWAMEATYSEFFEGAVLPLAHFRAHRAKVHRALHDVRVPNDLGSINRRQEERVIILPAPPNQ